jgi:hypothetical protein
MTSLRHLQSHCHFSLQQRTRCLSALALLSTSLTFIVQLELHPPWLFTLTINKYFHWSIPFSSFIKTTTINLVLATVVAGFHEGFENPSAVNVHRDTRRECMQRGVHCCRGCGGGAMWMKEWEGCAWESHICRWRCSGYWSFRISKRN